MPQIQVNEIDQSVVTRVVSDDKVKILVPIIASFGPSFDGEDTSVGTFTDITDFNRMFGYTEAEFNPIENDYSRTYAAQLIQKGSAVSVVRVNGGATAEFKLAANSGADRSVPSADTVCPASNPVQTINGRVYTLETTDTTFKALEPLVVPGSVRLSYKGIIYTDADAQAGAATGELKPSTTSESAITGLSITYATGAITGTISVASTTQYSVSFQYTDYTMATFCPQIASIEAKYNGSFGNNLLIAISPINTVNISQSYQYANITVYKADVVARYDYNPSTEEYEDKSVITNVTLLETKRVSTNPDDAYYFEDVDFEFIRIIGTPNARTELRLIWSNLDAQPEDNVTVYCGFPQILLKVVTDNTTNYNTKARLSGGSDFAYSNELLAKLRSGFKGYYTSTNGWTIGDVNMYLNELYTNTNAKSGIVKSLYDSIASVYANFTDPYIYDFDFITSGGFVYNEYNNPTDAPDDTKPEVTDSSLTISADKKSTSLSKNSPVPETVELSITDDGNTTQYTDKDGDGKLWATGATTAFGYVDYTTGKISFASALTATSTAAASYHYYTKPQIVEQTVPKTVSSDNSYTAYYDSVTPIHEAMRDLVNTRQDCVALFDVPHDYDKKLIVEYSRLLNTSYGTMHHPWDWVQSPTIAGKNILMAPSYIFLYTFLSNLIDNVESQKWFPPAGVKRATARVVVRPDYEIGSVILNDWQNDNTSRVNPIMKLKQYGYVIYGQYTTLQAIDLYTHSALESLNVRLIANVVKKKIFDTCLNMAFEPNTSTLWLKFYAQMDEFLRYMKRNEGVYDYKIKMDESTVTTDDINHLRCPGKVWIAPTRTAEFFDIDFIITESGALFPED